jgi:hypothetical protein
LIHEFCKQQLRRVVVIIVIGSLDFSPVAVGYGRSCIPAIGSAGAIEAASMDVSFR